MHEISLCENVLDILIEQARIQQFRSIKTVWLEIGELAGVEPDAMRFSFDMVMKGSLAENARLEILTVPGQARCIACDQNFVVKSLYDVCPGCGNHRIEISDGNQMRVKELEVE